MSDEHTLSTPIHVKTAHFDREVVESELPVVVDFWAPWCGPCRAIGPVLEQMAERYAGRVKVVKVNVDEEPAISAAFRIQGIPTIVAMHEREVIDVQVGFGGAKALERLFEGLVGEAPKKAANA
jgi:thioredoxin